MLKTTYPPTARAEALTGRLAEYNELLHLLTERPGLTLVSADPWSGTTSLLAAALEELEGVRLGVDARLCADSLDLAMAIADKAIAQLAPEAAAWWKGTGPPASAAGLALSRTLRRRGVDLDDLRIGSGPGERLLSEAIELLVALAADDVILSLDHLGLMMSTLTREKSQALLGELRAARQRHPRLDLVLVEHPDGPLSSAHSDRRHPMFQAGQLLRFHRPKPSRFIEDYLIIEDRTDVVGELIGVAAELAAGVPALAWRIIELAPAEGQDKHTRALGGWRNLRSITSLQTAREWDLLRRAHPIAQPVAAAVCLGLPPHAVSANPKSINDALARLRGLGLAWQPEPRRWTIADPLLGAWVRDQDPPWAAAGARKAGRRPRSEGAQS